MGISSGISQCALELTAYNAKYTPHVFIVEISGLLFNGSYDSSIFNFWKNIRKGGVYDGRGLRGLSRPT